MLGPWRLRLQDLQTVLNIAGSKSMYKLQGYTGIERRHPGFSQVLKHRFLFFIRG